LDLGQQTAALRAQLEAAIARVLDRGRFILGEEVAAFEREWAAFCGAGAAIGVGSGTQALEIALRAIGLRPGDEVITAPITAAFTALAICAAGGVPVFADVDAHTLLLDPESAASRITPRTRAIIPVHLYGRVADLDAFSSLARKHGLAVIQDACQAHGAAYRGRPLAAWSRAVAFSFYPTKNLGALGDGGAIVTNDAELARAATLLRNGGIPSGTVSEAPGINGRLDELQAALLRAKLPFLPEWTGRRRALAARYAQQAVPPVGGIPDDPCQHVFHLYVIHERRREALRAFLEARGIGHAVHYPVPLHLHAAFTSAAPCGSLPVAEAACREILSLPLHPYLSEEEAAEVCAALDGFGFTTETQRTPR
jgi:dTDP-3-amino-3,4,6-trideoxy-alpha-D-glucose transaminase